MIYLDYQATTPVDARVLQAMLPSFGAEFGNPSSPHAFGRAAADAVRLARAQTAALIGADSDEIVFTGSGTEATHLGVFGAAYARRDRGNHVITSTIEHPGTYGVCQRLEAEGFEITRVPVGPEGLIDPAGIDAAITDRTVLVTLIHGQNEIGTLQPVDEIAAITRRRRVLLHVDAAQSLTSIPVDVERMDIDLLTIVGHKMYAPKGIGALYLRRGVDIVPHTIGGGQERGLRAATENVPAIVGLGHAALLLAEERESDAERVRALRDELHRALAMALPDLRVNGDLTRRLAGNLNITLPGIPNRLLMAAVPDLAISAGSACHAASDEPSPVLTAIGLSPEQARSSLRIGVGRFTTRTEIDEAATAIIEAARKLGSQ